MNVEDERALRLARAVRAACVAAAIDGFEQAAADGLCCEGAWEVALDAIRSLDLSEPLRQARAPGSEHERRISG